MRRIASILVVTALVVGATLLLASLPGRVRIESGALSINAATPALVLALAALLLCWYGALRLLHHLTALPRRMRSKTRPGTLLPLPVRDPVGVGGSQSPRVGVLRPSSGIIK